MFGFFYGTCFPCFCIKLIDPCEHIVPLNYDTAMCVSGRRAVCAQYKRPESEAVGKRVVRACTSTRPVKGKGGGYGTAKKKLHSYAEKPTPMYFFRRESKKRNEKNSENPVPARPSLSISCPVSTTPNRNRPTHTPPP